MSRRKERLDARAERKRIRQENRTQRSLSRQETTRVMAEQGMRRGQGLIDVTSKGLDLLGDRMNGGKQNTRSSENENEGSGGMGMLLPLAVVGYILATKKK